MTETLIEEVVDLKEQVVKGHVLVLFDDNVNTFDHVIDLWCAKVVINWYTYKR